ncbi:MAG: PQQ-dependent sugar dehydrogenase [Candidatus Latescibacterota bacterium]
MSRRNALPLLCIFLLTLTAAGAGAQQPYGLAARVPNTSFLPTSTGYGLEEMGLRPVFAGVVLAQPVFLTWAPDGSDRIFVVERAGRIRVFPNQAETTQARTFLDLRARVNSGPQEAGMLSVAFHPQYATNGRLFVYYTHGNLVSRAAEFRVSSDPDSADGASERVVLEVNQPYGNHNGGMLAFGPDGYLYLGLGDGGGGGDPYGNGQNRATLLGAILRLDVDRAEEGAGYGIPPDNPFAGNAQGWRPEIWAWGLRNPWRFSFDRLTGEMWAGDVGQSAWEEIDRIEGGGNYGWSIMEGSHCFPPGTDCSSEGLILPVAEHPRGEARSLTGGYVYRGPRLARLQGTYLDGDYVSRTVWGLRYRDGQVTDHRPLATSPSPIASFGEDQTGEVYVVGFDGHIYRFEELPETAEPGNIPARLAGSGLYLDASQQTPAPGLIPYSVASELWSDGAAKTRLVALPDTARITFRADSAWSFPAGTALVKSFYLELEERNPASRRIVETRLLVRRQNEEVWDGFSYRWNDEGTDAELLSDSAVDTFTVVDPLSGESRPQEHYFPTRAECNVCHTRAAGYVLGVRTAQLNQTRDYDGTPDNQLRALNHIGVFAQDIGEDYTAFPRLPDPADSTTSLALRARSYLDANCSQCHLPGGTGRVEMDLRYATPLEQTGLVDVAPLLGDMGVPGAMRLKPGTAAESVLYLRMLDLGAGRMPPLASHRVDEQGAGLIARWIEVLGTETAAPRQDAGPRGPFLHPLYPNPFNDGLVVRFTLPAPGAVRLEVFDVLGRRVATLVDGPRQAGLHAVRFTAQDVASGVYLWRLSAASRVQVRRALLLR